MKVNGWISLLGDDDNAVHAVGILSGIALQLWVSHSWVSLIISNYRGRLGEVDGLMKVHLHRWNHTIGQSAVPYSYENSLFGNDSDHFTRTYLIALELEFEPALMSVCTKQPNKIIVEKRSNFFCKPKMQLTIDWKDSMIKCVWLSFSLASVISWCLEIEGKQLIF